MQRRHAHPSILILLLALALTACGAPATQTTSSSAVSAPNATASTPVQAEASSATPNATRLVKHALGETEVPLNPQRIVSLDVGEITDTLIALGRTPIGSVTYDPIADAYGGEDGNGAFPPVLAGRTAGIESLGVYEPNLEKVARLKPDLIIGSTYSVENIQAQLAAIAPTVVISPVRDFKVWLREIGVFVNAEAEAGRVLAEYEARAEQVRQQVQGTSVSVLRPRGDSVWIYGPPSNAGVILKDLGLELLAVPEGSSITDDAEGAIGQLSLERLPDIRSEHIFVISYNLKDTTVEELIQQPIWRQIPAVRQGNVHAVQGTAWSNHGPLGALSVIDEVAAALAGS
jgi:iron complex transport system substrate-binding protein